jgi:hypothetical protein
MDGAAQCADAVATLLDFGGAELPLAEDRALVARLLHHGRLIAWDARHALSPAEVSETERDSSLAPIERFLEANRSSPLKSGERMGMAALGESALGVRARYLGRQADDEPEPYARYQSLATPTRGFLDPSGDWGSDESERADRVLIFDAGAGSFVDAKLDRWPSVEMKCQALTGVEGRAPGMRPAAARALAGCSRWFARSAPADFRQAWAVWLADHRAWTEWLNSTAATRAPGH